MTLTKALISVITISPHTAFLPRDLPPTSIPLVSKRALSLQDTYKSNPFSQL